MTQRSTIKWRASVGSIQSRNIFATSNEYLYIGTCGNAWNVRDRRDGVHCLDLQTGAEIWFTPTTSDVNEIALVGNDLIVPTDAGDVFVLSTGSGDIKHVFRADSAIFGKPLVSRRVGHWVCIAASHEGTLYQFESGSSEFRVIGSVAGRIRAALTAIGDESFLIATEQGTIVRAHFQDGQLFSYNLAGAPVSKWGGGPSISAAPLVVGEKAFVAFARDTYDEAPAIFCIDLKSETVSWHAAAGAKERTYGNCRATPRLIDGKLIVASAYSDGVLALDPASGEHLGEVVLGQTVFQQWSGPAAIGLHHFAIGRVDGVCSIVDAKALALSASVSLATAETERLMTIVEGAAYSDGTFALYPGEPAPEGGICGTPHVAGNAAFVGTTDGTVVRIDTIL